jgi:hypothetical protein
MGGRRQTQCSENGVESEIDVGVDAFGAEEAVDEVPIEFLPIDQSDDVDESEQVREAILVEVEKEEDERCLRVQDPHPSPARRDEVLGSIPDQLNLSSGYLVFEDVEMEVDVASQFVAQVDGLQMSTFRQIRNDTT